MAVFGGKKEIMSSIAPSGPVYQAGTLSGNPVAMAAGLATLSMLQKHPNAFRQVEESTEALCQGLEAAAKEVGVPVVVQRVGSMFTLFFTDKVVHNFDDASACDMEAFKTFFHYNLEHGIYYAASQYESNFLSTCHSEQDLAYTLQIAKEAFQAIKG